jgi:hypothetical protein
LAGPDGPGDGEDAERRIELSLEDLEEEQEEQPAAGDRLVITGDDLADVPEAPPRPSPSHAPPGGAPGGRVYPGVSDAGMAAAMSPQALAAKEKAGGLAFVRRSTTWQNILAGGVGGFLAWAILEPFITDRPSFPPPTASSVWLQAALGGVAIGGMIGAALGSSEGAWSANVRRALKWGAIGLGVGVVGGLLGSLLAQLIFSNVGRAGRLTLIVVVLGRGIAWLALGMFVGTGQGIALRAGRKIINGLIGGAIGGFVGGVLFDVVAAVVGALASAAGAEASEAWPSRLIGFVVLGVACGAAIGIVEQLRKQAWLTIVQGFLAGKEFIIYTQVTRIGSSPACEITLLKDPAVALQHAQIELTGREYVLRDVAGLGTTYVNGRPVTQHRLRSGDYIQIGNSVIQYADREYSIEQVQPGMYRY